MSIFKGLQDFFSEDNKSNPDDDAEQPIDAYPDEKFTDSKGTEGVLRNSSLDDYIDPDEVRKKSDKSKS